MTLINALEQLGNTRHRLSMTELDALNALEQNTSGVKHLQGYVPLLRRPVEEHIILGGVQHKFTEQTIPEILPTNVQMQILVGDERKQLEGAHTTGDASLVLFYKQKPAVVVSFSVSPEEEVLTVHQFQSVHNHRGFRLFTGLNCPGLAAKCLKAIVEDPQTPCSRIEMPIPEDILGMDNAVAARSPLSQTYTPSGPHDKYVRLASELGMTQQANKFVVEIN